MTRLDIIPAHDTDAWIRVLEGCGAYDCYHLPGYHLLSEPQENGTGLLFVYREASATAAWPLVLREIAAVEGLEGAGADLRDMTSVYGYPGPVWNTEASFTRGFFARFQDALLHAAGELNVVSMFSRMNPVLRNAERFGGSGVTERMGETVSVDLTIPEEMQLRGYRHDHRTNIRRALRNGCMVQHDEAMEHFDAFIALYHDTMTRVSAGTRYFFDRAYFEGLRTALAGQLQLFVAIAEETPCAAGLFIRTGRIVQYHLSGSSALGLKYAGSKLVIDAARRWGAAAGAQVLHLGGGVGSQEDSLFHFKSGFSHLRHDFMVWKKILRPDIYRELVRVRAEQYPDGEWEFADEGFFPAYRANPVRRHVKDARE